MVITHAVFLHNAFHLRDKLRQEALGLGHRQRAGRQRYAGHRILPLLGNAIVDQAVLARQRLDFGFVASGNAGHDQVLVSGKPEIAFMDFGDFRHAGFQWAPRIIQNATVFNEQGQVPFIVDPLHPADAIAATGEGIRTNGFKSDAGAAFHFLFESLDAYPFERVFGLGVLAVGAIAPVALGGHHRLSHRQRMR